MKDFLLRHSWLFLAFMVVLGLTGPVTVDVVKGIYLLVVVLFFVVYRKELLVWCHSRVGELGYMKGLLFFVFYGLALVLIWSALPNKYDLHPSYSCVEELMSNYLFMPLFCLLIGQQLSQRNFERGMILFSLCTVLSGFFLLYAYFDISLLFASPVEFFRGVLSCRFLDCGSRVLNLSVFLKDYSFYPTLGALLIVPFVVKYKGWKRFAFVALFLFNSLFLFLTINRGTMLGYACALLIMILYFLRTLSWKQKTVTAFVIVAVSVFVLLLLPQSITTRFGEISSESSAFFESGHNSGSVSIRLTIWKVLLSHVREFWLFGDGPIYATSHLRTYLVEAGYQDYVDSGFIYHNQYLAYFHQYGIVGLLLVPFVLFYPLYHMLRFRKFSVILLVIIVVFALALMEDRYWGKDKVMMLLSVFYLSFFQLDKWRSLENSSKKIAK